MTKDKPAHQPGKLVKGPGTIRWKATQAAKTVAAVVREKRDERRATGKP
jgi:hypothetical protein